MQRADVCRMGCIANRNESKAYFDTNVIKTIEADSRKKFKLTFGDFSSISCDLKKTNSKRIWSVYMIMMTQHTGMVRFW